MIKLPSSNINKNEKYSLILLGAIICAVAILLVLVMPLKSTTEQQNDELMQNRQRLASYKTFAQQNPDYALFNRIQTERLVEARAKIPNKIVMSDILKEYTKMANEYDINLVKIKTYDSAAIAPEMGAFAVPLDVMVEGNYFNIIEFLNALENGKRYVKLRSTNIGGNEENESVTVNAQILVYALNKDAVSNSIDTKKSVDVAKDNSDQTKTENEKI